MILITLKSLMTWSLFVLLAMINGLLREFLLIPLYGQVFALVISGILLSALILLVSYWLIPYFKLHRSTQYFYIGSAWLALTLIFELVLGHHVMGKPWNELLEVFNFLSGNLFPLVLLTTFMAPWLAAKIRRII